MEGKFKELFEQEYDKEYFQKLIEFVSTERKKTKVYPDPENVFNALNLTPFERVKVVIIGQDPYHNGHAHGLSFSSLKGVPRSLRIIYDEISRAFFGAPIPGDYTNGNLTSWAEQGVLLLNTVFTVEKGKPNSHAGKGWETFTSAIIDLLLREKETVCWLVWGNYAKGIVRGKASASGNHLRLSACHPAAQLRGTGEFVGNNHFYECNRFLRDNNIAPINWDQSEYPYLETWAAYEDFKRDQVGGFDNPYMDLKPQKLNITKEGGYERKDLTLFPTDNLRDGSNS